MALKNYILNGPSVVIEDDRRDPHVSWQNHLDRTKGRGGVDLVAAVGTPIYAPTDGVMDWRKNDGSAGNSCRFWHDDNKGWKDVFSHLSRYIGKDMQHFKQGELIAYSGNSGGVTQHLHRHLLDPNDVRRNPWDHFTPTAATAGGTAKPVPPPAPPLTEEETMIYLATTTSTDGLIQKGWRYKQTGTGPFCAVSNLETIALQAAKIFTASYNGQDIRLLAALYGFAEHEKLTPGNFSSNMIALDGPGRLTGRVIFSDNAKPELPLVRIGV